MQTSNANGIGGRAAVLATLGVLVVAAVPAVAGATPPQAPEEPISGTYANDVLAECDGFDVVRNGTFTAVPRTFFSKDGEPVRLQLHISRDAVAENSATGKTVRDDAVWTLTFDLTSGTVSGSGRYESITVPGSGSVRYDIGHFVESPEGGWFAGRTSADDEELCVALAA